MNFKKILFSLTAMLAVTLIVPVAGLAQQNNNPPQAGNQLGAKFCSLLTQWQNRIEQRTTNAQNNLSQKREERQNKLEERRQSRDERRVQIRSQWDQNRAERFTQLSTQATNDAQKQALSEFQQAVEAAILTRKTAIDQSIQNFRQAVDQAVIDRKTSIDNLANAHQESIRLTWRQATQACGEKQDPLTVRTQLKNQLEAAFNQYKTDAANVIKVTESIQTAIDQHKAEVKAAIDQFKTSLETAKQAFKTAWSSANSDNKIPSENPDEVILPPGNSTPNPANE